MRVLDLFSGIGGFSLGLERAGMETVGFCEIEEYPRKVLRKHWPNVPIFKDIRTLIGEEIREKCGRVDLVCGGFPCQDISTAGRRAGITAPRSGLWREMARTIRVVRPKHAIVENVAAILGNGMGVVLGDLAEGGYDVEWHCLPASSFGMAHKRERVWFVAHPAGERRPRLLHNFLSERQEQAKERQAVALDTSRALEKRAKNKSNGEPPFFRGNDGLPHRVDRLKCLGNAVVPQIVEQIGKAIMEASNV